MHCIDWKSLLNISGCYAGWGVEVACSFSDLKINSNCVFSNAKYHYKYFYYVVTMLYKIAQDILVHNETLIQKINLLVLKSVFRLLILPMTYVKHRRKFIKKTN